MTRHEEIRRSYKELGAFGNVYDGIITRSTLLGKLMDGLIWGLDKELSEKWIEDALAPIPADFSGSLLEVPVGTGVLTMPLYASLPKASITCLDYSADMMENAKKRAAAMQISHVAFVQGDVGALPFADESFDLVLSLNGFHAFPDKDAAFRETCRVLKKGGVFCGCFYIAGEFGRTDWFVRHMYVPKGECELCSAKSSWRACCSGRCWSASAPSASGRARSTWSFCTMGTCRSAASETA